MEGIGIDSLDDDALLATLVRNIRVFFRTIFENIFMLERIIGRRSKRYFILKTAYFPIAVRCCLNAFFTSQTRL
jgi:hypothetical protein